MRIAQEYRDAATALRGWDSYLTVHGFNPRAVHEPADLLDEAAASCGAHDRLLSIAGLVNSYHNDGTRLTAAETLEAIADVLGDPF